MVFENVNGSLGSVLAEASASMQSQLSRVALETKTMLDLQVWDDGVQGSRWSLRLLEGRSENLFRRQFPPECEPGFEMPELVIFGEVSGAAEFEEHSLSVSLRHLKSISFLISSLGTLELVAL